MACENFANYSKIIDRDIDFNNDKLDILNKMIINHISSFKFSNYESF